MIQRPMLCGPLDTWLSGAIDVRDGRRGMWGYFRCILVISYGITKAVLGVQGRKNGWVNGCTILPYN